MPVIEHSLPELPDDWVPEAAVVFGLAKHYVQDDVWEASYPEFAIVGRGGSLEDAVEQANDLLEDYFRMCAADGMSFDEVRRPMPATWMAREITLAVGAAVIRRVRHRGARSRLLRMPARHALC